MLCKFYVIISVSIAYNIVGDDINGYKKYCLENALDDIDFLLENKSKIEQYETEHSCIGR